MSADWKKKKKKLFTAKDAEDAKGDLEIRKLTAVCNPFRISRLKKTDDWKFAGPGYSTTTDLERWRGRSTSRPQRTAT
jgi:hypothetical protein